MGLKAARVQVTVIHCPGPREVRELELTLPEGSTVAHALAQTAWFAQDEAGSPIVPAELTLGLWGRKTTLGHALRDGDRLEIHRPLQVDPKVARRERFNQQGAKTAGLFAKRRAGAKSGY